MSAKSCLLCGKPLSRIWVGSGEDFCSREHRNQYRLRRGMDRLLEANKLASLMRRRENLKPIPVPAPTAESDLSRHAFEHAQKSTPKVQPLTLRLGHSGTSPRFQPAGLRDIPQSRLSATHRELSIPARSAAKVTSIRARDLVTPQTALPRRGALRTLPQTPRRGLDLRVCLAAGFRLRPPLRRDLHSSPPPTSLSAPKILARLQPSDMDHPAAFVELQRIFPIRKAERPERVMRMLRPEMKWPGLRPLPAARRLGTPEPLQAPALPVRPHETVASMSREQVQPAGLPGPRPARIFALPAPPLVAGPATARTASVSFKPAESPFGYGTEESEQQ